MNHLFPWHVRGGHSTRAAVKCLAFNSLYLAVYAAVVFAVARVVLFRG